ncbi:glycoside hydrolase family 57 [Kiritimatiellota bacterium B12222]|nr:glycoside hydrolase family 57 [Kiritimatiellota bacterium B12222]
MSKPGIIFMPHGNLQYSQLPPNKRAWVVNESYKPLFEMVREHGYTIAFEASGWTLELMAKETPDVLALLKSLIASGQVEPVASPHIHIMIPNIDPDVGLASLKKGLDTWEHLTGVRPETGWNPECGWAGFVPEIYKEAGFKRLVMDADSYFLSYPEIREATGLRYDVRGHSNKNHLFKIEEFIKDKKEYLQYLTNLSVAPNGLEMVFRSDCMANPMLWYLMGATEGMRKDPVSEEEIKALFSRWHERAQATGSFVMPYAEDAEYIGTSAYFYVKQFNQARFFEPEPESVTRFKGMLDMAIETGFELTTPSKAAKASDVRLPNEAISCIENGAAWHGGTAKAWANTGWSRILDPVCRNILDGIRTLSTNGLPSVDGALQEALEAVTSAYVSDARWPPQPTTPGRFNVRESLDDLRVANQAMEAAMKKSGVTEQRGLYSPRLMETQIQAIDDELMELPFFGE